MLNEDKIKLMTKAASYESKEGRKAFSINHFFKGDYVTLQMLLAWIGYTVVYALIVAMWAFYKIDFLIENLNTMDLEQFIRKTILYYLIGLAVYEVCCLIYYLYKYSRNRKGLAEYYKHLKGLTAIYNEEPDGQERMPRRPERAGEYDDFT